MEAATPPEVESEVTETIPTTTTIKIDDSAVTFDKASFLARVLDDEELARTLAEAFLVDLPVQVAALVDAVAANDLLATERQAHKIKGAAANVGGEALRATTNAIEKAGKARDGE